MNTIPWVTCRKVALARSIAVTIAESHGLDWFRDLTQADRDARVAKAEAKIDEWKACGVVAVFEHPYREAHEETDVRRTKA